MSAYTTEMAKKAFISVNDDILWWLVQAVVVEDFEANVKSLGTRGTKIVWSASRPSLFLRSSS